MVPRQLVLPGRSIAHDPGTQLFRLRRAAALPGTEQDAGHDGAGTGPVLPVVRDAWLLNDRVTRAQHDLAPADHERDLTAQDRDVVQRAGGVGALELRVPAGAPPARALLRGS